MSIELWTLAISVITAVVCALCGSLLLINRQAMVSEGLSHAVLPGLVTAFIILQDYDSPLLIIAAATSGLLMVWLTQLLQSTRLLDNDASLGIVFAGMFSVGILLVSSNLRNTHFHADCIIDGNLALAPLDRLIWHGVDLGPRAWNLMLGMFVVVVGFISICFKELKLMSFDQILARQFKLHPRFLQFIWLAIVSLTTVAAFEVAGSILIVALMIAPPAAAYLLTDNLARLLFIGAVIASVSAVGGFYLSAGLDVSPTGPIASFAGFVFLLVLAFAPKRGLIAVSIRQMRQRVAVSDCLVLDLVERQALRVDGLDDFAVKVCMPARECQNSLRRLQQRSWIEDRDGQYQLTSVGRNHLSDSLGGFGVERAVAKT